MRVARRLAHQSRGQHPGTLDAREIAVVCGTPHVLDAAPRIAAAETDDAREEARDRAGAREAVVVHTQAEIAIDASRVCPEQTLINVSHDLGVFCGGVAVAVLLSLARAVAQRRRQPEVAGPGRQCPRPRHRRAEQRVDLLQRKIR